MKEAYDFLGSRIPKRLKQSVEALAQKENRNVSELTKELIELGMKNRQVDPAMVCQVCSKQIVPGEKYYANVHSIEQYGFDESGNTGVEIVDAIETEIVCEKCAKKQRSKEIKGLHWG